MFIDSHYIREGKLHTLYTGSYLPWAVITLVVVMTSSVMHLLAIQGTHL